MHPSRPTPHHGDTPSQPHPGRPFPPSPHPSPHPPGPPQGGGPGRRPHLFSQIPSPHCRAPGPGRRPRHPSPHTLGRWPQGGCLTIPPRPTTPLPNPGRPKPVSQPLAPTSVSPPKAGGLKAVAPPPPPPPNPPKGSGPMAAAPPVSTPAPTHKARVAAPSRKGQLSGRGGVGGARTWRLEAHRAPPGKVHPIPHDPKHQPACVCVCVCPSSLLRCRTSKSRAKGWVTSPGTKSRNQISWSPTRFGYPQPNLVESHEIRIPATKSRGVPRDSDTRDQSSGSPTSVGSPGFSKLQKQTVFHSLDLKSHELRFRRAKPRGIQRRMYAASQISWDPTADVGGKPNPVGSPWAETGG